MKLETKDETEQENTVDLNIVVLPDNRTSEILVDWSERISSEFQTVYTLNITDKLPHFSLYSARYPLRNLQFLEEKAENIAVHTSQFTINLSGFSIFSGFLFYDAKKDDSLMNLHHTIVRELNPLREGHISDVQRQLTGLTQAQQKAIQDFGYVSVGPLYMPHISITKMVNAEDSQAALTLLPNEELTFQVTEIAIAPFGTFGTCPQPINRLSLK